MKNDAGMTLIEVLIAVAITFIIFLGLSGAGIFVMNENINNEMRDEAVSVGGMEMERARSTLFDTLYFAPGTTTLPPAVRQVRGVTVNYGVTRTVTRFGADPNNLQVSINVTWDRVESGQTKHYSNAIATIVRRS